MADLGLGQRTAADAEVRRLQAEDRRRLSGDADEFVVAALAKVGQPEEARRVRDQMHLETKPEERTMIDHDPLVGPVFRRLASKV
jgi:pentatricopeptide repeat protein